VLEAQLFYKRSLIPMSPRREDEERLRGKISRADIVFEGPVPPLRWPSEQKRVFHVIRDISANRFGGHADHLSWNERRARKKRVQELVAKAYDLRAELGMNEDTWRSPIESIMFERFDKEIVWQVSPG